MRRFIPILYLASLAVLVSSCYTTNQLIDDDVYVVKNSSLPVGESLTDETSYATYKYRTDRGKMSSQYYQGGSSYLYNRTCNRSFFMDYSCGCSYYGWNMYNPYMYNPYGFGFVNPYYGSGLFYAFGNMVYDPFTGAFLYNPYYYSPYGMYGGYNPYYGGYYGNNYNTYNYNSTPVVLTNHHEGPRGGLAGYTDPTGRSNPYSLKMTPATGKTPVLRTAQTTRASQTRPLTTNARSTTTYRSVEGRVQTTGGTSGRTDGNSGVGRTTTSPNRGGGQPVQRTTPAPRGNSTSPAPSRGGGGGTIPSGRRN